MVFINVQIKAGSTPEASSISATGTVSHVITDSERQLFGIEDADLKNAVGNYLGKNPKDVCVRYPTPWPEWDEQFKNYHWQLDGTCGWHQVTTVLTVTSATIIGVTSQLTNVHHETMSNNSPVISAKYITTLQNSVTNTVETSWSQTFGISFEQSFTYKFGSGSSHSTAITVGSSSSVEVELRPKQAVKAVMTATRSFLKARITYTATLTGLVAVNYNPRFKDHHHYGLDIGGVMRKAGLSNSRQITEDIEVGYYSNGKMDIS
eukprot:Em0094g19a